MVTATHFSHPSILSRSCSHPIPHSDLGTQGTIQAASLPSRGLQGQATEQVSTLSLAGTCLYEGTPWTVHAHRSAQSTTPWRNEPFQMFGFLFSKSVLLLGLMTVHLGVADLPPQHTDFRAWFRWCRLTIGASIMCSGTSASWAKSFQDCAAGWSTWPFIELGTDVLQSQTKFLWLATLCWVDPSLRNQSPGNSRLLRVPTWLGHPEALLDVFYSHLPGIQTAGETVYTIHSFNPHHSHLWWNL